MSDTGSKRRISGRLIVVLMFGLGFLATGLLFLYWHLHLMPFMPFQEAIAAEFRDASPRVDGGRRKLHQQSPMMLRIVMRVPFDPTVNDEATDARLRQTVDRLQTLARQHTQLSEFKILEAHFYFPMKEQKLRERTVRRDLSRWDLPEQEVEPATGQQKSSTDVLDRAVK